ncbi:MAG: alkaline phosphatase family protein [Deltaproteobacteria bacterium]|nr:alkaline phosphatase family protein [Deltaproteobacteria bacterium]
MTPSTPSHSKTLEGLKRIASWLALAVGACGSDGTHNQVLPYRLTDSTRLAALRRATVPKAHTENDRLTVVLVAVDGVRWQDVVDGPDPTRRSLCSKGSDDQPDTPTTPHLERLLQERGAGLGGPSGHPFRASGPRYVSLPGYVELMTGRRATGCLDNECVGTRWPTLADDFAPRGGAAVVSSWPVIARAAGFDPSVFVSAGRRDVRGELGPLARRAWEAAANADPAPGYGDYRPDHATAEVALHVLDERRPAFLFVGLGDTDEHAHHGNYCEYLRALRSADEVVGRLSRALEERERSGDETLLVVTTDHGRDHSFADHGDSAESGRVWLVAAGRSIAARGWIPLAAPGHLADIAATVRLLARIEPPAHDQGRLLDELVAGHASGVRTVLATHP